MTSVPNTHYNVHILCHEKGLRYLIPDRNICYTLVGSEFALSGARPGLLWRCVPSDAPAERDGPAVTDGVYTCVIVVKVA